MIAFSNLKLEPSNQCHDDLIDAYHRSLNSHDRNILPHANQYKSFRKLEQDIKEYYDIFCKIEH